MMEALRFTIRVRQDGTLEWPDPPPKLPAGEAEVILLLPSRNEEGSSATAPSPSRTTDEALATNWPCLKAGRWKGERHYVVKISMVRRGARAMTETRRAFERCMVDTNVLVYATIDEAPRCEEARQWMRHLQKQGMQLYMVIRAERAMRGVSVCWTGRSEPSPTAAGAKLCLCTEP
jgi:hypothetical protein